jgi:hypothetical protein
MTNNVKPETRVVEYRETIYVCSNGSHDARSIWLWRGKWYCTECLKRALRKAGATQSELYSFRFPYGRHEFGPEGHLRSAPLERVTPTTYPPSVIGSRQKGKQQVQWCEDCECEHTPGLCEEYV